MRSMVLLAIGTVLGLSAFAQASPQSPLDVESTGSTPTFVVNVTSRTVEAVNYQHRSGATKIDFAGTTLMPSAKGEAKVESKKGYLEVEVESKIFKILQHLAASTLPISCGPFFPRAVQ